MKTIKTTLFALLATSSLSAFGAQQEITGNGQADEVSQKKEQVASLWAFYQQKNSADSRREFFKMLNMANIIAVDECIPIPDCIFPDKKDGPGSI